MTDYSAMVGDKWYTFSRVPNGPISCYDDHQIRLSEDGYYHRHTEVQAGYKKILSEERMGDCEGEKVWKGLKVKRANLNKKKGVA